MLTTLIMVLVLGVYTYVTTCQSADFKYVKFMICQLRLIKTLKIHKLKWRQDILCPFVRINILYLVSLDLLIRFQNKIKSTDP